MGLSGKYRSSIIESRSLIEPVFTLVLVSIEWLKPTSSKLILRVRKTLSLKIRIFWGRKTWISNHSYHERCIDEFSTIASSASNWDRKSLREITLSRPLITHLNLLYSIGRPFHARMTISSLAKCTPAADNIFIGKVHTSSRKIVPSFFNAMQVLRDKIRPFLNCLQIRL